MQTGDLTGQTAAVVLYSADGALRMTGTISKDDIKYVSAGVDVKITDNNNNDISGATVENITENKEMCIRDRPGAGNCLYGGKRIKRETTGK